MEKMLQPYYRYADFEGRSSRSEYWLFTLFNALVIMALMIITIIGLFSAGAATNGFATGQYPIMAIIGGGAILMFILFSIIPSIAVQVRRFHDQDKSGWFVLLGFIPYVGGLIVFVFMCLRGTSGPNRFGPDPLDPYNAEVFG